MPIDHVSVGCKDVKKARAFYDPVMATLGYAPLAPIEINGELMAMGYGEDGHPSFWVQLPYDRKPATMGNGVHIAFTAPNRAAVDAFYLAALEAGGIDDGEPGLRTHYHPNYYGAFVRDKDGNKLEACCHMPE